MINPSTLKRIERLLKKGYSDNLCSYVNKVLLEAVRQHEKMHREEKNKK